MEEKVRERNRQGKTEPTRGRKVKKQKQSKVSVVGNGEAYEGRHEGKERKDETRRRKGREKEVAKKGRRKNEDDARKTKKTDDTGFAKG